MEGSLNTRLKILKERGVKHFARKGPKSNETIKYCAVCGVQIGKDRKETCSKKCSRIYTRVARPLKQQVNFWKKKYKDLLNKK